MDALVGRGLSGRPFRRSIERLTIQYNVYSGVLLVYMLLYSVPVVYEAILGCSMVPLKLEGTDLEKHHWRDLCDRNHTQTTFTFTRAIHIQLHIHPH